MFKCFNNLFEKAKFSLIFINIIDVRLQLTCNVYVLYFYNHPILLYELIWTIFHMNLIDGKYEIQITIDE